MPNVMIARPAAMRPNVVVADASRPPADGLVVASLRSRELEEESSCRGAETRRSCFCAVRSAMPFARLPDIGFTHKTLKIVSYSCSHGPVGRCNQKDLFGRLLTGHRPVATEELRTINMNDFSLIGPILYQFHKSSADRIFTNVIPFLRITLIAS